MGDGWERPKSKNPCFHMGHSIVTSRGGFLPRKTDACTCTYVQYNLTHKERCLYFATPPLPGPNFPGIILRVFTNTVRPDFLLSVASLSNVTTYSSTPLRNTMGRICLKLTHSTNTNAARWKSVRTYQREICPACPAVCAPLGSLLKLEVT